MRRCIVVTAAALMVLASFLVGPPAEATRLPVPDTRPAAVTALQRLHQLQRRALHDQSSSQHRRAGLHSPTAAVTRPVSVALDPRADTLYVPSDAGPIAVIDAHSCSALVRRCKAPVATLPGHAGANAIVVDPDRHSLYVTYPFGTGELLVFDTTHCTARDHSGCGESPTVIADADLPFGLSVDTASHTLYVGHFGDVVDVLDTVACNGSHRSGCGAYAGTVETGPGAFFTTVDHARHTLYVSNFGSESENGYENGSTVSVVDIARCRAADTSGCAAVPVSATVGPNPFAITIDPQVDTIYVTNLGDSTISVLPRSTCGAADHSGCPTSPPPIVRPGANPQAMVVDRVSRTLFVQVQDSNVVTALDTRRCNAHATAGCTDRPRRVSIGAEPFALIFDSRTRTVYTADLADNVLEAVDARMCNAETRRGCRREAPTVAGTDGGWSSDEAHHTYFQVGYDGSVLLTDTRRCTVDHPGRCAPSSVREQIGGGRLGSTVIDRGTHTAYIQVQDPKDRVLVVDTNTCNVTRHDGCAPKGTIPIADDGFPRVDPRTHTVYVPQQEEGQLAVVDGTTCNASDVSGCDADPLFVAVGSSPYVVDVDVSTDTIWVANTSITSDAGNTLTLLPATACAERTPDCRAVATTAVGGNPLGITVDSVHHTLYAATFAPEGHGTVALIDSAACNASHPTGCGATWHQLPGPRTPFGAVVDPAGHRLYTQNIYDASVSVIDTGRCNATSYGGCPARPRRIAVDDEPVVAYPDTRNHTLYVAGITYGRTSLIDLDHPCRKARCFR